MAALDTTFGMLFIGLVLATFLFGIAVALVILLDTAGTACAAQGMYWYLVTNYGDPSALAWRSMLCRALCVESLITVLVTFIVQCFFAHSVWNVSGKNRVITCFIVFTSFSALVIGLAMSSEDIVQGFFSALGATRFWVLAGLDLGIAAMCDIAITASLCYYFHYQKSGFKPTDTILDKLIVYTINRGIMTFVIQTLNMALFIGMPDNLIWGPFHMILSKVYTIAFLATLNRRGTSGKPRQLNWSPWSSSHMLVGHPCLLVTLPRPILSTKRSALHSRILCWSLALPLVSTRPRSITTTWRDRDGFQFSCLLISILLLPSVRLHCMHYLRMAIHRRRQFEDTHGRALRPKLAL
ncbi:hypothetical protein A0H81_02923 [Grifola frondosa]|uniref:DUF6534 domain-containing protein n=1 Tax=Grifola frondosa TaxID=5627 RepID=A0A1C7MJ78_GRIFR|nr:hypothetical protein A0H81_02923 [Grifola frondosa]